MREYFCCFPLTSPLMRCTTISSATLLSSTTWFFSLLFAFCFAANFSTPPSWNHVQAKKHSGPQGTLVVAALGHAKIDFHFAIESECKFWYGRALPLILFFIFLLKVFYLSWPTFRLLFCLHLFFNFSQKRVCCAIAFRFRLAFTLVLFAFYFTLTIHFHLHFEFHLKLIL